MRLIALLLLAPAPALAFCGFFVSGADAQLNNDASQVVLMRHGQTTVMTMSNTYKGPTEDFAMVVPVPVVLKKAQVKTLKPTVFKKVDQLSAPRLVKYWERDPCEPERRFGGLGGMGSAGIGKGGGGMGGYGRGLGTLGVKVEAKFTSGEYEVVILSAKEANGLETWLRLNAYNIPQGASAALAPYIKSGMKFFVAKVDIKKVKRNRHRQVVLSPLQFHFEDKQLRLPVRLGLLNAAGTQDLIVYILHQSSRFEVANYKNVFIPSNLEVTDAVQRRFGSFYADLFDKTLAAAGGRAVVTEYAWQAGKCDPCPTTPLQTSDLADLGGRTLGLTSGDYRKPPPPPKKKKKPKKKKGKKAGKTLTKAQQTQLSQLGVLSQSPFSSLGSGGLGISGGSAFGQPFFGNASTWVLTRLHTRYDKATLSEDLIFVPAKPVTGGRGSAGKSLEKPGEAKPAATNNFQARYIMREYWSGKVECAQPRWGRWGGPPRGPRRGKAVQAARDLANAERGAFALKKVVKSRLPRLKIPGQRTKAPKR